MYRSGAGGTEKGNSEISIHFLRSIGDSKGLLIENHCVKVNIEERNNRYRGAFLLILMHNKMSITLYVTCQQ